MDLGRKPSNNHMETAMPSAPEQPDIIYPSFSVEEEVADKIREDHPNLQVGDFVTFTGRAKVSSIKESAERYDVGCRVGFDLHSMDDIKPAGENEEGDEGGAGAEEDEGSTEEEGSEGTGNPAIDKLMKRGR